MVDLVGVWIWDMSGCRDAMLVCLLPVSLSVCLVLILAPFT